MDVAEESTNMAAYAKAEFPILSDPEGRVVREYGIYNLLRDGMSAPAAYIVRPDGTIIWRYVSTTISDRPSASDMIERLP